MHRRKSITHKVDRGESVVCPQNDRVAEVVGGNPAHPALERRFEYAPGKQRDAAPVGGAAVFCVQGQFPISVMGTFRVRAHIRECPWCCRFTESLSRVFRERGTLFCMGAHQYCCSGRFCSFGSQQKSRIGSTVHGSRGRCRKRAVESWFHHHTHLNLNARRNFYEQRRIL